MPGLAEQREREMAALGVEVVVKDVWVYGFTHGSVAENLPEHSWQGNLAGGKETQHKTPTRYLRLRKKRNNQPGGGEPLPASRKLQLEVLVRETLEQLQMCPMRGVRFECPPRPGPQAQDKRVWPFKMIPCNPISPHQPGLGGRALWEGAGKREKPGRETAGEQGPTHI